MTGHCKARSEAEQIVGLAESLKASAQALCNTLSSDIEDALQAPTAAERRRLHLPGSPSKLATDSELRAFVLARIEVMTFDQVVRAVAESFPPGRRISRSALHRWWHRRGKHILRGHAKPRNIR
jgi:hypothetical protein